VVTVPCPSRSCPDELAHLGQASEQAGPLRSRAVDDLDNLDAPGPVYVFRVEHAPGGDTTLMRVTARNEQAARLKATNELPARSVIVELVAVVDDQL
jgi:hypothetical protein